MTLLDLVGKLHRTVYVAECVEDGHEDLLRLMQGRCGPIEAWDVLADTGRLVIVFQSLNSVSNALSFNGLSFVDLARRIIVWRANDPPPPELAQQQLALGGPAGEAEDEADHLARREARQHRRAAVQQALGDDLKQFDYDNPAVRKEKMMDLCRRQLTALNTITAAVIEEKARKLEVLERDLAMNESLLTAMNQTPSA